MLVTSTVTLAVWPDAFTLAAILVCGALLAVRGGDRAAAAEILARAVAGARPSCRCPTGGASARAPRTWSGSGVSRLSAGPGKAPGVGEWEDGDGESRPRPRTRGNYRGIYWISMVLQ
jgi:hypothetical protein